MESPFVSVVIPVYGVEKYIEKCLESCFSNTIAEQCEFLIINDCSPDKSIELATKMIKKYPNITVKIISHEKNKGLAAARNTGLKYATGKYIINVDSDDWVDNIYLEKLYTKAEENHSDIVICNLYKELENKQELIELNMPASKEFVEALLEESLPGWLPIKMFRLDFLRENNITWIDGVNMCEDLILSVKAFSQTKRISFVDEALYHYNNTNLTSLSSKLSENKANQLITAVKEIESYLDDEKYNKSIINLKCRIKVWILKKIDIFTPKYVCLYNDDKLSKNKNISILNRLFFFLCEFKQFKLIKIIVRLKG
jgi:glycosyltransferase involved in cell wall biosynthesis